ncbi:unnamed protein product [Rotaria magnacalcarata]|uniref:Uncharacterized protein n=1 Tax=Rotaria magnacalcarata TaxID=392030 RepID=A0A816YY23_9BILA|nr:unnamed protein product [Rotaria magnacalcarata]CAF1657750.1 unnamed protein product [Rotaria magnacalcarata]CAF2011876.1 unnamed protein product [Rotaria magnacalcarata]CAF2154653.1 unnamed protein product [Rotaria magnacalcarata]CAF2183734.1 unnamed protein product [Rotaria magnacalcarata]
MSQPWKAGLFGCFEDIPICLLGWCCGCYLFGQNAEQIDGSNKFAMCCGYACLSGCYLCCILHKPRREALRNAFNLEENPSDFLATCCCSGCAVCQEAIELKQRGIVPGSRIPVSSQPR